MQAPLTKTIFKSSKIYFETMSDDNRCVKASDKINNSELLLVELVYSSDNYIDIPLTIQYYPELFNSLYPRKMKWDKTMINAESMDVFESCQKKYACNSFNVGGRHVIGNDISRFNHSTSPNTTILTSLVDVEQAIPYQIAYIYAINDINIDEEITIWYGNKYFSENTIPSENMLRNDKNIERYVSIMACKFLSTEEGRLIILKHLCIYYGLHFINGVVCPTDVFIDFFHKNIKMNCNIENIETWIKSIKTKIDETFV